MSSQYDIQEGTLLENFTAIEDWTITTGTGAIDTSIAKDGHGSLKLISGLGTNCYGTKTINLDLSQAGLLYTWIYVEDVTELNGVTIYLSNDSGFANFFSKALTASSLHNGWNKIAISKNSWSNSGSPTWSSNIVRLRVRIDAIASVSPVVYFSSIFYGFYSKPKVIISFDDGWDSNYSVAYPYMKSLGLKGTCYLIQERIDTTNYLTTDNIQEMHSAGWDMCNHTVNHINMSAYSQDEAAAEIVGCKNWLSSLGFTRRNEHLHLAYPQGGYNDEVLLAMGAEGMLTGRTIITRTQANEIDERYLLTRQSHSYTASVATYLNYITRTIAEGGSIQINYHKIVPDGTGAFDTEVEETQFKTLMNYVSALHHGGVIDCVSFTEWYVNLEKKRKEIYT